MSGGDPISKDGVEINVNAMTLATELPYAIEKTKQKQRSSEPYMPPLFQAHCQDPPTRMHQATSRTKTAALCHRSSNYYPGHLGPSNLVLGQHG